MIQAICPHCTKAYRFPPDLAGRKIRCKGCEEKFRVPGTEVESDAVPSAVIPADQSIAARCPRCLADYTLKPKYAGETVRCKTCRTSFHVPNPNAPAVEDIPPLDELTDVTLPPVRTSKVAAAAKIQDNFGSSKKSVAPTHHSIGRKRPEPEIVELTDDDVIDDDDEDTTGGYDLDDDHADMISAARQGTHRAARAPLSRMSSAASEGPVFTPQRRRRKNDDFELMDVLQKVGSVVLTIVLFVGIATFRHYARKHRYEQYYQQRSAAENKNKTGSNEIHFPNRSIQLPTNFDTGISTDPQSDISRRQHEDMQKQQSRLKEQMDEMRNRSRRTSPFDRPRF